MDNQRKAPTVSEPTPTEWLIMEVLAARWRLSERSWHFPNSLKPALKRLAMRDWIAYKAATVEGHQQAWLRTDGKLEWGLPTDEDPFGVDALVYVAGVERVRAEEQLAPPKEPVDAVDEREHRWWQWGRR